MLLTGHTQNLCCLYMYMNQFGHSTLMHSVTLTKREQKITLSQQVPKYIGKITETEAILINTHIYMKGHFAGLAQEPH